MSVQEFKATHLYRIMDLSNNLFRLEPIMIFEGRGYSESDWYSGDHATVVFENGWRQIIPGNPDFKWYIEPIESDDMEHIALAILELASDAVKSASDLLETLIRAKGHVRTSVRVMCLSIAGILDYVSHHIQNDITAMAEEPLGSNIACNLESSTRGSDGASGKGGEHEQ